MPTRLWHPEVMKRVIVGTAVIVAAFAVGGCGSDTVATAPPPSPSSAASPSSADSTVPYDQIDATAWRNAMVAAGAHSDIDLQAVYAATAKLCAMKGDALSIHLATRGNEQLERVAFKYVCPSRLKAFDSAAQVAD